MKLLNKPKYSECFDHILPWFPIYLKEIDKDGMELNVYILKFVEENDKEAYYYKVSGEWGFIVKYDGYKYFKQSNGGIRNFISADFIPSSAEAFLKNNQMCKLESTRDICIKVWNDIASNNNLAKEQVWEYGNNGYWYHFEYYYNNKYMLYEL